MQKIDLCRRAIDASTRAGASEAEALIAGGRTMTVDIERGQIKASNDIFDSGIAIRVIVDGRIGLAYSNILTRKSVEEAALRALKAARASPKDDNWRSLPERKPYPSLEGVYDEKIAQLKSDAAVEVSQRALEAAVETDKRVLPAFGGTSVEVKEMACVNTQGVEVQETGTRFGCYLGVVARSETQVSPMCVEFKASRAYEPEPEWVGQEAAKLAVQALNVGKAESGKFPVLLDPFTLESILTYTLIESVKGDNVHRGKSALRGKIGEHVAAETLNVLDDGTMPGGLNSSKTDMEGVPRKKTCIIEHGVLRGFLYDNYWARIEGKESTGNANRGGGGLMLPVYGTTPSIQPSNVVLEPGTASDEELLEEVGDGYYVREVQGAHQSNPETGEFSVALAPAWRIEKGRVTHAVKGTMIAGNVYDLLMNIKAIGKDARQVGTLVAPKVVVIGLKVVSQ